MSLKTNLINYSKPTRDLLTQALVSLSVAGIALSLTAIGGCAHLGMGGTQSPQAKRSSDQVIKADPHTGDPLTSLEQELTKVHSDRVIVSTALLKSLVKNERLQQNQCKNISGQLEAIKNIDLEETQESGDSKP